MVKEQMLLKLTMVLIKLHQDHLFHIKTNKMYHLNTVCLNHFYQFKINKTIYMAMDHPQSANNLINNNQSPPANFLVAELEPNSGEMTLLKFRN
jgi:hypothetical protein